jgi:hypothetical protein
MARQDVKAAAFHALIKAFAAAILDEKPASSNL